MTLRGLLVALLAQTSPPDVDPEVIARHILRAVEGDSLARVERRWEGRLARSTDDRAAHFALGWAALLTYRYTEAEGHFERVLGPVYRSDQLSAHARLGIAAGLSQRSHFGAADSALALARSQARAANARGIEAEALIAQAQVRLRTTGAHDASRLLDTAAMRIAGLPDSPRRRSLTSLRTCAAAYVHVRLATPGVRDTAASGAALAAEAGEPRVRAACLGMIAQELERQGKFDSAVVIMGTQVEPLMRHSKHWHGLATALQWEGYITFRLGVYALAWTQLTEAVQHATRSGNGSALSWSHVGLAQIAIDLGDVATAATHLARARTLLAAQGDRWGLAIIRGLEADIASLRHTVNEARNGYLDAIDSLVAIGNPYATLERYRALVILEQDERRYADAERWLQAADSIAKGRVAPGWQAERPVHEAANALGRGQAARADSILARVLERTNSPPARFEFAARHAEVLARRNDFDGIELRLADAADAFSRWRSWQSSDRGFRLSLLQSRKTFGVSGAGVPYAIRTLAYAGRVERAFAFAEERRAREVVTRMAERGTPTDTSLTTTAPRDGSATPPTASLAEVKASLPVGTALIEYLAGRGDEPVTAFVVTRDGARLASLAPNDSLGILGRRLSTLLSSGARAEGLARTLGSLALDPVLEMLPAGISRLVIVSDGGLHRVPFEALRLRDGRWLVERYSVSTVPSATVLLRLAQQQRRTPANPSILVFGAPRYPRQAPDRAMRAEGDARAAFWSPGPLAPLPYSAREARNVGRYFPRADVRLGTQASEHALRTASLEGISVLHFATHAVVDDELPGRSAIALASGNGEDGFVNASELATLSLDADLVVLSGCRTAQGAVVGGEGVQGLTAPLLETGARAVLATRWAVRDREASSLIVRFYDAMARGSTAGDALRKVQQAAIAAGEPPITWASFTLIGDHTVRPALRLP